MAVEGPGAPAGDTVRARPLVLVVDDDKGIREAVVSFLDDVGFATAQACNGLDAVNLIADAEVPPTLIVLDLMMPVLDGWAFCQLRQGIQSLMEIPVVAVSAGSVLGSREPLRVDATLAKPFDPDELAWLVTRVARRRDIHGL
ncbi:MAG TPA: response regulator [Polyangia bacterium]|jgi:CheY-like chemotaxis protein|nr:response regulator [Polyangia bacterium]